MATMILDCKGMKCPQPVLKVAIKAATIAAGTILEVHADCPSFSDDVTKWCADSGRVLVGIVDHGSHRTATIQF